MAVQKRSRPAPPSRALSYMAPALRALRAPRAGPAARIGLAALALLLFVGCTVPPPKGGAAGPDARPEEGGRTAKAEGAAPPLEDALPAPPPLAARELEGLRPLRLRAAMHGAPDLAAEEGEVVLWQYRGPGCVLDVALRPPSSASDAEAPGRRVFALAARDAAGRSLEGAALQGCLDALRAERFRATAAPGDAAPAN